MRDFRFGRLIWSIGLSLAGLILLFFNTGLLARFEPAAQYLLSAFLLLGGFGFFGAYATEKQSWWRLMPAWTFIALCFMVFLSTMDAVDNQLNASLLFAGLSAAFFHIYFTNRRDHWWTVIPGGFMLVIGGVLALSSVVERAETLGGILFIGMGGVFFLLYSLGRTSHRWWSLIPGSILVIFGLFVLTQNGFGEGGEAGLMLRWWPVSLIVIGLFVGIRTARTPQQPEKIIVKSAPKFRPQLSTKMEEPKQVSGPAAVLLRLNPKQLFSKRSAEDQSAKPVSRKGPLPGTSIEILPDE